MSWLNRLLILILIAVCVFFTYAYFTLNEKNKELTEAVSELEKIKTKDRQDLIDSIEVIKVDIIEKIIKNEKNLNKLKLELQKQKGKDLDIEEAKKILGL